MIRPLRIEDEEATYHVIARENYRKDYFTEGKIAQAFEYGYPLNISHLSNAATSKLKP